MQVHVCRQVVKIGVDNSSNNLREFIIWHKNKPKNQYEVSFDRHTTEIKVGEFDFYNRSSAAPQ